MNALEINGLTKSYKDFKLDNVSFDIPEGSITGFIGENGAGKSTTIKLILGVTKKGFRQCESSRDRRRCFDQGRHRNRHG